MCFLQLNKVKSERKTILGRKLGWLSRMVFHAFRLRHARLGLLFTATKDLLEGNLLKFGVLKGSLTVTTHPSHHYSPTRRLDYCYCLNYE